MRKVVEHRRLELLGLLQAILENEGIVTLIKNEGVTQAEGVFFGDSSYPELWVVDDGEVERALEVLGPHLDAWRE